MTWTPFDYILGGVYLAALLALGVLASRKKETSNDFLNATGALPLWMCIAACIAANCGSLDVIAMMGLGAQYGMLACHFYWIGAIPALIVVAFWLLPAYARGRYPTVLDFIASYYGQRTRSAVALCMAAMMLLLAGVCLCAAAQTMAAFLGWRFGSGILVTAAVVLFYTWMGGLRATVYTELLHFAIVLLAIVPLFFFVLHDFGGLSSLVAHLPAARVHAWKDLPLAAPGSPMDLLGVVFGLGIIPSFGYWGTDFVQMQRALAVRRAADVPFVPLSIAAAKIIFSLMVVLPGIAAPLILGGSLSHNWNTTLPSLMLHYFRSSWMAVGVIGLTASLVSTFANNVCGFSSAFVQGVYQGWIRSGESDSYYFRIGRVTSVVTVALSIGAAYSALSFQSLMEYIQMILSTFNAPIFALVALAAVVPKRAAGGGLQGLVAGLAVAIGHHVLFFSGISHYGSRMAANFYAAILSFSVCAVVTLAASRIHAGNDQSAIMAPPHTPLPFRYSLPTVVWAGIVFAACVCVNIWLR
jgi:solute:Na+ symporter, SSS family